MKNYIKDFYGRILGYTEDTPNRIIAYDFYGRQLGYYDKRLKTTHDFYGRIIGQGDLTSGLIYNAKDKK